MTIQSDDRATQHEKALAWSQALALPGNDAMAIMFARSAGARAEELDRLLSAELDARLAAEDTVDTVDTALARAVISVEAFRAASTQMAAAEVAAVNEACDIIVASIEEARRGQRP